MDTRIDALTSAPAPLASHRSFLANVWALARPYWFSEDRWKARGLLLAIVVLNLTVVGLSVLFNQWYGRFYNALQEKNWDVFVREMGVFTGLAAINIAVIVYALYLNQMLQIRWRRWLTEVYFSNWLGNRIYYRLELKGYGTDNPDQRIAEDLAQFPRLSLTLALGLMRSVVSFFSFLVILWTLSGPLTVPLGPLGSVTIPGYMVWVAIVYAALGSWLTHWVGRRLIRLNFDQQRYEADFRFSLVRLRENAEGVALYRGEEGERQGLRQRFDFVWQNWWNIMRYTKRLTGFTTSYEQAAIIFPFVVAAPRYFSGAIQLGGLIQISSAFNQVQNALSWFVEAYSQLVLWKASTDRLITFDQAIASATRESAEARGVQVARAGDGVALEGVTLERPDGTDIIRDANTVIHRGDRVLVTGPTGSGKSTLFRAIAGIWPFGSGSVRIPAEGRTLFLPQRPYMPITSLRAAVAYPAPVEDFTDAEIRQALHDVGLPALAERLDEVEHWGRSLSPGEQQRLAFARALLQRPDWLFLDEATSAVDEASEQLLYGLIAARMPGTTVVSIAHRPTLAHFHRTHVSLHPNGGGAGTLRVEPLPVAAG